jgi:hypothetical protein
MARMPPTQRFSIGVKRYRQDAILLCLKRGVILPVFTSHRLIVLSQLPEASDCRPG